MDAFSQIEQDYIQLISQDPNACVELGLPQRLGDLPDPSMAAAKAQRERAEDMLTAINALDAELLSFEQQQDLALMALSARQILVKGDFQVEGQSTLQMLPQAGDKLSAGIFLLVVADPRPAQARLDDILSRLQQAPEFLSAMLARLQTPVARWVNIELETLDGLPGFFATIADWAEQEDYEALDSLRRAIDQTNDAMERYAAALKGLLTTEQFAIGAEQAQRLLAANGIEQSLESIHSFACDFVSRTQAEIEALRQQLCQRYELAADTTVQQLQQWLYQRYAVEVADGDLQGVIRRYQDEANKIEAFIRDTGLFPIPAQQRMQIMQTPAFMAPMIPAGAMMQPAAMRPGEKVSQIYLTLSEALLDEHTELGIPVMMIHEGIPGHHLQLATASLHDSPVRRVFPAMELAEGWTTMLEDYMLDQGYMGSLTDEARFIAKLDISRISARVAIDLYFLTGERRYLEIGYPVALDSEDPFINAGALLQAVTGFTEGRVQAELNWYSQERGYPMCYLLGNTLVWQLKRDFDAHHTELTERERDQAFHRHFLQAGNMPMAMLRQRFAHLGLIAA
ncbi:DUF885 family protein [Ferrimonas marina]|uniref:Uncharacterized conserved protein, DUF885 familyt n=1 Tax=Ferrimonas marina TaxID=299255 RepID=A0A1M5VDU6_9GAMM|nr:DUF885 family protein [Ferrimonas marina]SHH73419.1 Uncharacterized conserved protein, DUF885 familyt [Ferrimonas marina]